MKSFVSAPLYGICLASLVSILSNCRPRDTGASSVESYGKPCTVKSEKGDHCQVRMFQVVPTQTAVGMREVSYKIAHLKDEKDPLPVVVGPDGNFYLIDHHHLALAFVKTGIGQADAEILKNWADHTTSEFWDKMRESAWVYLYDEHGDGPIPVTALPKQIWQLKDDPFRSLAGAVRDKGGFQKTDKPYMEFTWANFFRKKLNWSGSDAGWHQAIDDALQLAKSSEAKSLPGAKK